MGGLRSIEGVSPYFYREKAYRRPSVLMGLLVVNSGYEKFKLHVCLVDLCNNFTEKTKSSWSHSGSQLVVFRGSTTTRDLV